MLFGEHTGWRHVSDRRLKLVFPASNDIPLAFHHGLEAGLGYIDGIVFLALTYLGIEHVRAFEEVGFSSAWHKTSHRHAGVLQLVPQREREGVNESFRAIINSLKRARHEARDRASDKDAALSPSPHLATDLLDQVDRTRDVGIDHVTSLFEILIEKGSAKPVAGIGEQTIHLSSRDGIDQLVDAFDRGQI